MNDCKTIKITVKFVKCFETLNRLAIFFLFVPRVNNLKPLKEKFLRTPIIEALIKKGDLTGVIGPSQVRRKQAMPRVAPCLINCSLFAYWVNSSSRWRREIPNTVSVLCRERLWVVVDWKRRYRNGVNEWMRTKSRGWQRGGGRGGKGVACELRGESCRKEEVN